MKELENLEKRLADIQKEIETLKQAKPEFEKDCWYKIHYTMQHCYGLKQYDSVPFYIVRFKELRMTSSNESRVVFNLPDNTEVMMSNHENTDWLEGKATLTEIKEALEKEAVKRGFVEGAKCVWDGGIIDIKSPFRLTHYGLETNEGFIIMDNKGQWATVIKEQPLMIGEYPVKAAIEGVTINHTFYPESSIFKIKEALEVSNIKSVNVGCNGQYKVDLEMINKIIKLIK